MSRSSNRRWPWWLALLAVVVLGMTGCMGGAAQATSWTGLTVVGDVVYAADVEQARALSLADGSTLWTFPRDPKEDNRGAFYATPVVGDGITLVTSLVAARGFFARATNVVWALDDEGRDLWSFDGATGQYVEGGALADGVFVIGNSDGNVYALDTDTGDLLWKFKTGHRVWAMPLIDGDRVYIGSMDRHLYALNLADGEPVWDFQGGGAFASRPVLQDGVLYIGAFDDKLYAIDAATGKERWAFEGENWFWGAATLGDGNLYAADVDGRVYAVDPASGIELWRVELRDDKERLMPVRAGVVLSADGTLLFVGTRAGTLYALDAADGHEVWSSPSAAQLYSEPVVVGATVVYPLIYGAERIRALSVDNGREIWTYAVETAKK